MPGFITHYYFGVDSFKEIKDKELKKIIADNRSAYSLGLLGPDLFYCFIPSNMGLKPNMGSILHKKKTGKFFRSLIDTVAILDSERDFNIAMSYIEGFMGHYVLDTAVHPYVYSRIGTKANNTTLGVHFGLETDIDRKVYFRKKGKRLCEFNQDAAVDLNRHEKNVISQILGSAILSAYGINITPTLIKAAIVSFSLEGKFLTDRANRKHKIINAIEKTALRFEFVSPLLENDIVHTEDPCNELHSEWSNPWETDSKSTKSVWEIMEENKVLYADYMIKMRTALKESFNSIDDPHPPILKLLGNNSYNSGLDCSIELSR